MSADLIDLTAQQVRCFGSPVVHLLGDAFTHPENGRTYTTPCGLTTTGDRAMLSTRAATCARCVPPAPEASP